MTLGLSSSSDFGMFKFKEWDKVDNQTDWNLKSEIKKKTWLKEQLDYGTVAGKQGHNAGRRQRLETAEYNVAKT